MQIYNLMQERFLLTGKLSDIPTFDSPSCLLAFTRPRAVEWRTFNTLSFIKLLSNKRDMCARQGKLAARVENKKRDKEEERGKIDFHLMVSSGHC